MNDSTKLTSRVLVGVENNLMEGVVRVAVVVRSVPAQPGRHSNTSRSEFILQRVANSAELSVIGCQVQKTHLRNHKHHMTLETLEKVNRRRQKTQRSLELFIVAKITPRGLNLID
jgi:hypothetical protein